MALRALVLQHIACEPPGTYEDVLDGRDVEIDRIEIDEGDRLPDWRAFDAIIAMGGPMGAGDDDALPWLSDEKRLIAEAVEAGKPFWGVCLGVQLLAASLGARVYTGPAPEVGILPVTLTEDGKRDPVFGSLPEQLPTLQWHGETFDLPRGAVRLAGSPAYPNQAFRLGRAYGVQFHLEVSPGLAREWAEVPEYAASLEGELGSGALVRLVAELESESATMASHATALLERWLDRVVAPAAATAVR